MQLNFQYKLWRGHLTSKYDLYTVNWLQNKRIVATL
jgi:hypothetical protein